MAQQLPALGHRQTVQSSLSIPHSHRCHSSSSASVLRPHFHCPTVTHPRITRRHCDRCESYFAKASVHCLKFVKGFRLRSSVSHVTCFTESMGYGVCTRLNPDGYEVAMCMDLSTKLPRFSRLQPVRGRGRRRDPIIAPGVQLSQEVRSPVTTMC
jgi:hypothetical protein